jgi:lysyl-tRNA synthetase class 2
MRVRRAKRADMLAAGLDPYPVVVERTHSLREVRSAHPDLPPDTATGDEVGVAGRVIFLRNTGKLCFATLRDGDGTELQAMLSLAVVGEEELARWKAGVDLGDHVFVHGEVATSRRGELSVMADRWAMAAKSVRPLPVAHRELSEETRVRQRYVDLIVRPQAREMVRHRAQVVRTLRSVLHEREFVEVETPMLQLQHGGATARPFVTHANALDTDLYLRIAPELFLKRCVVGGIERVFEINRNFRNEGCSRPTRRTRPTTRWRRSPGTWCWPAPGLCSVPPWSGTRTAQNMIWVVTGVRSRCTRRCRKRSDTK